MSTALLAGLIVIPVAFCLCILLVFLGVWAQMRGRNSATRKPLPVPTKNYHSPATSVSSFKCAGVHNVAAPSRLVHSQWHARPEVADQSAACRTFTIYRGADVLADAHLPRVKGYSQVKAIMEPLVDRQGPFPLTCGSAQRFSLDLESAWPQPLQPAWTESKGLLEQQLWRNSSGNSSCYSRPDSWYDVAVTGGLREADLNCGFGAGPGPTVRAGQTTARRWKALPPVPTQEEQRGVVDVAATNGV